MRHPAEFPARLRSGPAAEESRSRRQKLPGADGAAHGCPARHRRPAHRIPLGRGHPVRLFVSRVRALDLSIASLRWACAGSQGWGWHSPFFWSEAAACLAPGSRTRSSTPMRKNGLKFMESAYQARSVLQARARAPRRGGTHATHDGSRRTSSLAIVLLGYDAVRSGWFRLAGPLVASHLGCAAWPALIISGICAWLTVKWPSYSPGVCGRPYLLVACFPRACHGVFYGLLRLPESAFQRAISAVGRTALSNYLLQSFCAALIFHSWGFGQYGRLSPGQLFALCFGIIALQLACGRAGGCVISISDPWNTSGAGSLRPGRRVPFSPTRERRKCFSRQVLLKSCKMPTVMQSFLQEFHAESKRALIDRERELELALCCFVSGGNLLIEDTPGVGKTTSSRSWPGCLGWISSVCNSRTTSCRRTSSEARFSTRRGRAFPSTAARSLPSLVLGDELNRASPRTQSAVLQAMDEHEVTIEGHTHILPEPFFFVGTQTPRAGRHGAAA